MNTGLSEVLRGLYLDGDLESMRGRMLHSTSWMQHGHTAFGEAAIERNWMTWFAAAGLSTCSDVLVVNGDGEFAEALWLQPQEEGEPVRVGLWAWHNRRRLRRVVCLPDIVALAHARGRNAHEFIEQLPVPDPLMICDYDQQRHPHSVEVSPLDLVELEEDVASAVSAWWSLWTRGQLSAIETAYHADARIELPGCARPQTQAQMLEWCSEHFLQHQRRFCQPESALVDSADTGRVAVLWNMEADLSARDGKRRIRMPFISLLEVGDGLIHREVLLTDLLATQKELMGAQSA